MIPRIKISAQIGYFKRFKMKLREVFVARNLTGSIERNCIMLLSILVDGLGDGGKIIFSFIYRYSWE